MKSFFSFLIIVLLIISCRWEKEVKPNSDLERFILELPNVEVSLKTLEIDDSRVTSILGRIENSIPDKLFLIDHNTWSIFMADNNGRILNQKGGAGRGPGEYAGINDMYVYQDENLLQVLDRRVNRITYYDISADSLKLSHSVPLPKYGQSYLQNVYKSSGNTIGIFKERVRIDNSSFESRILVYLLDEELNKIELIHEFLGSELIENEHSNGAISFNDNAFGNETHWSFHNGKLFYSNAENLNFSVFNFKNNQTTEYEISDIPDYLNTPEVVNLMLERYSLMFNINPKYENYLKERKKLPYFISIISNEPFIYFPIRNYVHEKGYILRYNLETAQMERIETHPYFYMKGVNEVGIYGTITESGFDDKTRISILEF